MKELDPNFEMEAEEPPAPVPTPEGMAKATATRVNINKYIFSLRTICCLLSMAPFFSPLGLLAEAQVGFYRGGP